MSRTIARLLRLLPFIAVVYAGVYLYRHGHVDLGGYSLQPLPALAALAIAVGVFVLRAWIWYRFLKAGGIEISFRLAMASRFLSIFAKYIPGKVWSLVGPAQIVSETTGSLAYLSTCSFLWQLTIVLAGLLLGLIGFGLVGIPEQLGGYQALWVGGLTVVLLVAVYTGVFNTLAASVLQRFRGDVRLDALPDTKQFILVSMVQWLLTGLAFWVFFLSLGVNAGMAPILLQGFANTIGMVAVFVPAGLGVREGVMIAYLSMAGLSPADAVVLALASRVWFFCVEVVVFVLGVLLKAGMARDA